MDFKAARRIMVDSQIRPARVTNKDIIDAMSLVPREIFVPQDHMAIAYMDEAVPLGGGRFLMEPMVMARLLQAGEIEPLDEVLIIGCATGYMAAIASRLAKTVVGVESDPVMVRRAAENLAAVGADNAVVLEGDIREGCPTQAPFNVIIFNGAIAHNPAKFAEQTVEGSRVVAVVQARSWMSGRGTVFTSIGGRLIGRDIFDAGTPLLPGFALCSSFTF
jgi:protein-L-isoaspartate(D-aspartate) O-methyltransferase